MRRILNEIVACDKVEVIIVDDNSTCVSIDVFAEEYPSFIFAHNNSCAKGAGSARNIGIGIASGKYLAFFDSDDMIVPGGIQTLIEDAEGGDYDLIVYPPYPL
ncbi:hypothetical protein JCM19233_3362 [Vibrio astriarenae]|nr:hypothetical protein JCM19233_3362 [Vibrio sp. C7]